MNLADFPFLNFNFVPKAKKRNNLEMVDQDKENQLKSYMDRLPPPTQAELEALASYSSMFLGYIARWYNFERLPRTRSAT